MGTRADFYVGRGLTAEWLGSVAYDGDPRSWRPRLMATDEADYRMRVSRELALIESATFPSQGWPWAWNDSRLTDYSYAWDEGRLWCSNYGGAWTAGNAYPPCGTDTDKVAFPDMSKIANFAVGPRSGFALFRY